MWWTNYQLLIMLEPAAETYFIPVFAPQCELLISLYIWFDNVINGVDDTLVRVTHVVKNSLERKQQLHIFYICPSFH